MSPFFGFSSRSQQHLGLPDFRNTFISFLGTAQLLSVDLLPITWNPALKDAGVGGTATLHERSISRNLSLVFKRVDPNNFLHYTEKATEDVVYRTLTAEIATARHYDVVKSDHLAHLEGICWDIERGGKVWPVLVYEKARYGSLKSIVESPQIVAPTTLDVTAKLRMCTHIARGLATLHHSAIVHGDIKPDNVIIFEDKKGGLLAKITDFGFATFVLSVFEQDGPLYKDGLYLRDHIQLTGRSYWSSPARHGQGYTFKDAILEEVYSFGMTCFWTLFSQLAAFPSPDQVQEAKIAESMPKLCLKLANDPELGATDDQIKLIKNLFTITVAASSDDRATLSSILDLLESQTVLPDKAIFQTFEIGPFPADSAMSIPDFHLMRSLTQLLGTEYRVREHVRHCMEAYIQDESRTEVLQRTHFELACCYHLGFGGCYDPEKRDLHLSKANKTLWDIEIDLKKAMEVKGVVYFEGQFRTSLESGLVPPFDLVQSFRDVPANSDLSHHMQQEVKDLERALGPTNTHIIHMKADFANLLWEQGQVKAAWSMLHECLEMVDAKLTEVDPWDIIFLKGQLAEAEHRLGHWQKAETLCRTALEEVIRLGGDRSGEAMVLKNQLALALSDLGSWDKAVVIQQEIVEDQRERLGPKHPITLQMTSCLVQTLIELGEYDEAEKHIQFIASLRDSVWGSESQDTLLSLMDEARLLDNRGDVAAAAKLEKQALDRCTRSLEKDHPYTLDCMMNLAYSLSNQAQADKANVLGEQCVKTYERVRGKTHPDTLRSKTYLAVLYHECGRYKDALVLDCEAYNQLEDQLGLNHPFTLHALHGMGISYYKLGELGKAEEILTNLVELRSSLFGLEHHETLQSRGLLAVVCADQGKLLKAIEMAEVILSSSKEALGSTHRDTLTAACNLASYYTDDDDVAKAIVLEEETLAQAEAVLDPDESIILTLKQNLAASYMDRSVGRYEEALSMAEAAVASREKPGINDPEGLSNAQSILAQIYARLGRKEESKHLHRQVYATRLELFSEDHPDTQDTLEVLQELDDDSTQSGDFEMTSILR